MPITYPSGPTHGADIVSSSLRKVLDSPAGAGVLKGHTAGDASVSAPHQTYFVRLDDLAKGLLLEAAKPVAWRYLIYVEGQAVAEIELTNPDHGEPTFLAFHEGPFANASDLALSTANALTKFKKTNWEVRYLKIPSVYFAAIWLHGKQDDSLIPLMTPPPGLKVNSPYSEAKVISALSGVARKTQQFERKQRPK
jgi:hypothetical protein